jgi:hypothetical protein
MVLWDVHGLYVFYVVLTFQLCQTVSALLEQIGVLGENHLPVVGHLQNLSKFHRNRLVRTRNRHQL